MKTYLALLCACLCLLTLTACGEDTVTSDPAATNSRKIGLGVAFSKCVLLFRKKGFESNFLEKNLVLDIKLSEPIYINKGFKATRSEISFISPTERDVYSFIINAKYLFSRYTGILNSGASSFATEYARSFKYRIFLQKIPADILI